MKAETDLSEREGHSLVFCHKLVADRNMLTLCLWGTVSTVFSRNMYCSLLFSTHTVYTRNPMPKGWLFCYIFFISEQRKQRKCQIHPHTRDQLHFKHKRLSQELKHIRTVQDIHAKIYWLSYNITQEKQKEQRFILLHLSSDFLMI